MPNFDNPAHRTTEQRLNRAVPFRRNDDLEHLLAHPELLDELPPSSRIAAGLYASDRATHEHLTGGDAA